MIIDCPIAYKASVVPPRKRNAVTYDLVDHVAIEIRETTSEEAPVVLWWSNEPDESKQVAVRSFEGELYRPYRWSRYSAPGGDPCTHPDPAGAVRPLAAAVGADWYITERDRGLPPIALETFVARLRDGTVSPGSVPTTHPAPHGSRIDEIPIRTVESSGLEATRRQWQAAATGLLAIDGVMFHKAPMPVYVIKDDWSDPVLASTWLGAHDVVAEQVYPVDEWDRAASRLREMRGERHLPHHDAPDCQPLESHLSPPPNILRADLLPTFDVGEVVVRGTAKAILERLEQDDRTGWSSRSHAPTVTRYDRPVMMAYAHLRDAFRSEAALSEVVSRLRDLNEAMGRHGTLRDLGKRIERLVERVGAEEEFQADVDAFAQIGFLS